MMMNKNGNAPAIEIVCSGLRPPERNRTYAAAGSVFFQSDKTTEPCPDSLLSISLKAVNADCKLRSWMTAFPLPKKNGKHRCSASRHSLLYFHRLVVY